MSTLPLTAARFGLETVDISFAGTAAQFESFCELFRAAPETLPVSGNMLTRIDGVAVGCVVRGEGAR